MRTDLRQAETASQPMRVKRVAIYLYEPSDGGLDRVAILLANHLAEQGVQSELWMTRLEGPLQSLVGPNVTIRQVGRARSSRGMSMMAQLPALRTTIRRYQPQVLYSAGNQSNLLVACAGLGMAVRTIGRISNPIVRPGTKGFLPWLRRKRFQLTAWLMDATIVMGKADQALLGDGCPALQSKLCLLPRPTVTPLFLEAGRERPTRKDGGVRQLLAVGRLVPQKDHATMLSALARLKGHDWRLRIVGQGPLLEPLRRQSAELGLSDRIEFLGFVGDPARLAALYGSSEVLLQSSRWEGLSATPIEALACGCQVVITDCTANLRDIIDAAGQHPMVPVGDVEAFAAAIDRTLSRSTDTALSRRAAQPYEVGAALAQYHALIDRVAA